MSPKVTLKVGGEKVSVRIGLLALSPMSASVSTPSMFFPWMIQFFCQNDGGKPFFLGLIF